MAIHKTKEEKRKIAMMALQTSFRVTASKHNMSESGVRKILKTQLRTLFLSEELEECSNINDYRRLFKEKFPVEKNIIPGFKSLSSDDIKRNIKIASRFKTSEEIATSMNILGVKNVDDSKWTAEKVQELI